MKKFLSIVLVAAAVLAVCLVGCKDNEVAQGTATGDVSGDMISLVSTAKLEVNAPYQDYITAEMAYNFVGLTEEEFTANVEEGVFYESMMSPANQSYCLLKVKEGADVAALKQKVFDNANPRKWICMSADRVLVMADSEYVMLAMGPVATLDTLKTEFTTLAGGDVTEALDKTVNAGEELPEGALPGMDDNYFFEEDEDPLLVDPENEDEVLDEVLSGDETENEEVSGEVSGEVEEVPAA
ncbi:MAG: hypothetical protein IJX99_03715 [Clostridia bacterium]|nr:hypothetical protein [Clostridia bacterium]